MNYTRILFFITYIFAFIGSALFAFPLGGISVFPFRILMIILLIIMVFQVFYQREIKSTIFKDKYFCFFLLWWFYSIVQLFWSLDLNRSVEKIFFFTLMLLLFIFTSYLINEINQFVVLFYIIVISVIIINLFGWINVFSGKYLSSSRFYNSDLISLVPYNIPTSVFTNENDLGVFLATMVPFFLSAIEFNKKIKIKLIFIFLLISNMILIILTGSRGSFLALGIGIFLYLISLYAYRSKLTVKQISGNVFLASILIVAFTVIIANIGTAISFTYNFIYNDASNDIRINLIKNGFQFLQSTYGFGIGLGSFESYMLTKGPNYYASDIINIHNWLAEIFVESGFLIGTLYILVYVSILKNIYKIYIKTQHNNTKMITKTLLIALLVLLIASNVPSSFFQFRTHWILVSLSVVFLTVYKKHIEPNKEEIIRSK
ncbi:O-antigen ligase family protein [Domibacillus iocasae]|uniref:O-antigen ligase-related domain-containing protein n=1 Tax=Domibacillus iocasae TaxID=1714016 RepID=A0A1E7DPG8_9BACI|nr:O-antigen ligase family protein [Domibacillus iocasae]OES44939.1 hypothetical protein BA724_06660 [Domibacillus iocasae]